MKGILFLCIFSSLSTGQNVHGFQYLFPQSSRSKTVRQSSPFLMIKLDALQKESEETINDVNVEAERLMKEAEIMRLQAEKMDLSLTLDKIKGIEAKLDNKRWLEKNPDKETELQSQLQTLNDNLRKKASSKQLATEIKSKSALDKVPIESPSSSISEKNSVDKLGQKQNSPKKKKELPKIPLAGFDGADLELYIPIANDINKMIPNATIEEKLEAFRTAPELQAHFQEKIKRMFVGPLEDMQNLESLKKKYLDSSSSKERENLKREIDRMEADIEEDTPFMYSESFYCEALGPLSETEVALRLETIGALPDILIAIYKQRNGLGEEDNLQLAIELDYYEPQLQLLGQAGLVGPLSEEMKESYFKGYNSLPVSVRNKFCSKNGLESGSDASKVLEILLEQQTPMSPMMEMANAVSSDPPEYNDIDFVDRSRFLEEFYPSIGGMEGEHPSQTDIEKFASEILNRKSFMVTSKPERVIGGYYIRGSNLLSDDKDGKSTASDKLIAEVSKRLDKSDLDLEFFYILDPSPPTDEEVEFGSVDRPLFVITTKNPSNFYSLSKPATKTLTTLGGLLTTIFFSMGACALNPSISDRFTATLDTASSTGILDLQWLVDLFLPVLLGTLGIQLSHELGHRLIAFKYKFDIGLPNMIPSITTGLTGCITPLKSPPPNAKALFDFAIAGPLSGFAVSFMLLLTGLELTSSMDMNAQLQLPVLPVDLIRASSLGGGMVQLFLGNSLVMPDQGLAAVAELHPLAVAGFIGCITNSLALLPLGHTDGGRISVSMFGRRGAFVVKLFTTLLLCLAGIFGFDDVNILLTYVLFASIWQRELETPLRNEVDELDFPRGLLGISAAILVGLTLIPMF